MTQLFTAIALIIGLAATAQEIKDGTNQKTKQLSFKKIDAVRTHEPIKIDGDITDQAWASASRATDFVEWRPSAGMPENEKNKTVVYFLYDNTAVYIAGFCYEQSRDSISRELIGRDKVGINDFAGVIFDTYNDKINGVGFYVTPYGEQFDAKYSSTNGEDGSWSAVWDSEAKIHDNGWSFEMRIPYSALRFTKENHTWGLNITRRRNKTGQQYMWNPIDPQVSGFMNQSGVWTGLQLNDAPVRLSLSPYFSTYANHYPSNKAGVKNLNTSFNGGMDVKYGINDAFTLDMTLIPDFGQVQSDNQVLNLSPFEVRFDENRSFFTEGTELFSKGNLFYSRRIGGMPMHYHSVKNKLLPGEKIIDNPMESRLINASKISGRNNRGLGIGVFNAITKPMYAVIEDNEQQRREIETAPLTNYNILVLDQTLKHNSSISLINTNVLRGGADYDANVTAALYDFNNKKNTYNWNGKFSISQLLGKNDKHTTGYSHRLGFGKTGGRFNFRLVQELVDHQYQINDMGLMFYPNYFDHYLWFGYKWIKPGSWFNQLRINNNYNYSRRFTPSDFQSLNVNINGNAQLKNLWWVGSFVGYNAEGHDFYEPQRAGRVFKTPRRLSYEVWVESNNVKKYSFSASFFTGRLSLENGRSYSYSVRNRYRFNDKLSIDMQSSYRPFTNNVGYNSAAGSDVIFALRDRVTVENVLNAKFNFNNRSGITFRARHYWSEVENKKFYLLQQDGSLSAKPDHVNNSNQNFNIFNIDMVYTWQFAPGSFINIVWKNNGQMFNDAVNNGYLNNFERTLASPQNNNISLKVLYFFDYLDLKKWKKKS